MLGDEFGIHSDKVIASFGKDVKVKKGLFSTFISHETRVKREIKTNSKHEYKFTLKFKLLQILVQVILPSEKVIYMTANRSPLL